MPPEKQDINKAESPSPEERHREFSEENGRWNEKMEEALTELDELAEEPEPGSSESEPTPA
jgi:hypothetical protein